MSVTILLHLFKGTAHQFLTRFQKAKKVYKGNPSTKFEEFLPCRSGDNSIFRRAKINIFIFALIFDLFWSITQKVRITYLPKFSKPVPKNLRDSNLLALYN